MVDRIVLGDGKLIVSKAGKDASDPTLTPGDMLFNSDWLFSGTIIAAGVYTDSASYFSPPNFNSEGFKARELTNDSFDHIIPFPTTLPYVPTVLLIPLGDSRYWHEFGYLLLGPHKLWDWDVGDQNDYRSAPITVSTSQIKIPRLRQGDSPYRKYREDFIWVAMGM